MLRDIGIVIDFKNEGSERHGLVCTIVPRSWIDRARTLRGVFHRSIPNRPI